MSAQALYDLAPVGAVIRYSDGTPRPPERHVQKLRAWKRRNGQGRLVEKTPEKVRPTYTSPAGFALHEGDYGSDGVVVLSVRGIYDVGSSLKFEVVSVPPAGAVLCLTGFDGSVELQHLAADREAAIRWAARNCYSGLWFEEVQADGSNARVGLELEAA